MTNPFLSITTVFIQFACIIYLIFEGSFIAASPILLGLQVAGVLLGIWAMVVMRRFNVAPDPLKEATLTTRGPYQWIRHPMYTAVLIVALGAILHNPTPLRIAVLGILFVNLVVKLRHEEVLMLQKFSDYRAYMNRTSRLIPFVF